MNTTAPRNGISESSGNFVDLKRNNLGRGGHRRQEHPKDVGTEGDGKEGDADPGHVLREAKVNRESGVQRAKCRADQGGEQDAGPEVPALIDPHPARHGADGHDALDPEVQHARALAHQFSQSGEDQRADNAQGGGPETHRGKNFN